MIGYVNCRAITQIIGLELLLDDEACPISWRVNPNHLDYVAGWGRKKTALIAKVYADFFKLPYLSLEDGFLRSCSLGVEGAAPHSIIVDDLGIYFDATRPSRLEHLILDDSLCDTLFQRAENGIQLLHQYRLSKYNHAPEKDLKKDEGRPVVLVVDQTYGDASVKLGMASPLDFTRMLETAAQQNSGADIWVKVHPDVLAGKKKSYLLSAVRSFNCRIIAEDISPWSLFDQVDKVYAVTSQLGFEALIAGKEVHCFGMPFYAGWGLTHDQQKIPRRGVKRNLQQLFAAAYLLYPRYINPTTGLRCDFEDTIINLALEREGFS